ncbi:hypothetical protein [Streptomyces sp. NBC_01794]|uniref:hypothetical protein n=1 Tax=Streptomyces sp. NBC_01794 TaxID=2975942 RepID=UPI00308D6815|nr:hypothetical protein OIE54_09440 [Streptomyces sp. NBC_01794]
MPVSLDKIPAPKPEDMDRAPAYRVELRKLTAPYFVVADTTGQWTPQTPHNRVDVLTVERAADNDVERGLQRFDIEAQCFDVPGLVYVELYAVSAGDAALKARHLISTVPATFEDLMDAVLGDDA